MPHFFWLANGICPLPAYALDMSALESLMKAASALDKREQQEEHLRKCAKQVHESLSLVWPKSEDEPSFPDDVCTPILANEYYLHSMPTTHCDGHFNANILFLMESHQLLLPCPAWTSHTPSHASMMLCYITQCTPYSCNTMLDTLTLFTVQHMVSYHSSNLTQPKWFQRAKNVPSTLAPPNFGEPC